MIADLHSGGLESDRWGAKVANLSALASAGLLVPPGLCLWPHVLAVGTPRELAIEAWLAESRANSVIVRSSTANEDEASSAGAGRSLSIPSVRPDVGSIARAIDAVTDAAVTAGLDIQSVLVQQEVVAPTSGVAFFARHTGDLTVEAADARFGVTGGSRVTSQARITRDGVLTVERGFLTAVEARGLYETSVRCADILGFDPDLEWGSFAGAIFLFQARPITRAVDD